MLLLALLLRTPLALQSGSRGKIHKVPSSSSPPYPCKSNRLRFYLISTTVPHLEVSQMQSIPLHLLLPLSRCASRPSALGTAVCQALIQALLRSVEIRALQATVPRAWSL